MNKILKQAEANQRTAREIIAKLGIVEAWEAVGAEVHLVGSLKTGLLMKHRDIDFHIYSDPLTLAGSFAAMATLAADPQVKKIECANLLNAPDRCIEWHLWYDNGDADRTDIPGGGLWQVDMMHIVRGSTYDGYFERVAERIEAVLTPELRDTILRLKFDTPDDVKIMGIEYYLAAIRDGVRSYDELVRWRAARPEAGIIEWMP